MRRKYDDEIRAQAIARVLAGESVAAVAREMEVSRQNIEKWMRRKNATSIGALHNPSLLDRVGEYLDVNLTTMRNQAARMGERAWIEAQTTANLISAHDHLGRRLVAILDRLRPQPKPEERDNEQSPD